jgi:hypothetical protein
VGLRRRNAIGLLALACVGFACTSNVGTNEVVCGDGVANIGGVCVVADAGGEITCGPGTMQLAGFCVPLPAPLDGGWDAGPSCGPGTSLSGNFCVPDGGPVIVCGPGTVLSGGECVASGDAGLLCGAGTHLAGAACVPDGDAGPLCAAGTHVSGGACIPNGDAGAACGAGTIDDGGVCVPLAENDVTYQVRLPTDQLAANGYAGVPVLVLATRADGTQEPAQVVLGVTVPDAGRFAPTAFTIGTAGFTSTIYPCTLALVPACSGTFQITLALQSAPDLIVATSPTLTLVQPAPVGSDVNCLDAGNVLYLEGDPGSYVFVGQKTVTDGGWSPQSSRPNYLNLTEYNSATGDDWEFSFSSVDIGVPLDEQVYADARDIFTNGGHPSMDVSGDGRACDTVHGQFQIEELRFSLDGGTLEALTATFEQYCEHSTAALRGCLHYEP